MGQGDATLISTPNGRHILVDAGPNPDYVAGYLRENGIDTLDLVVASHNHADHIGGLPAVFRSAFVRAYLENGMPSATGIYSRLLSAVEASGALVLRAESRTLSLDGISVRVLAPPCFGKKQNSCSIGLVIRYGEFTALLTGDSERSALQYWLSKGEIPNATLVKVAHHGSADASTSDWVQATNPEIAVISVGKSNSYGHPSPDVLNLWSQSRARVFRTDLNGTVLVRASHRNEVEVYTDYEPPLLPTRILERNQEERNEQR